MTLSPVFFPFTHMGEGALDALEPFFSNIVCLPLDRDWAQRPTLAQAAERGLLLPVFPHADVVDEVEGHAGTFQAWADLHRGNERNLGALLKDSPYFCDDTQLTRIQSQILKGSQGNGDAASSTPTDAQRISSALLFLKLAQDRDAQEEKIQGELAALERNKSELFSQLKGEVDGLSHARESVLNPDPGRTMTRERIAAWAAWARHCGLFREKEDQTLLLTTSSAVFEYLEANAEGPINTLDIESIKGHEVECDWRQKWQKRFANSIQQMVETGSSIKSPLPEAQDGCRCMGRVQLGLFSGKVVEECFNQPGISLAVCRVELK